MISNFQIVRYFGKVMFIKTSYSGQGKKRALLIGINYTGTDNELNGKKISVQQAEFCNHV